MNNNNGYRQGKDYSDDPAAYQHGLKARSTLDLTKYLTNTLNCASRITGTDDYANSLFEKLHERAFFIKQELDKRKQTGGGIPTHFTPAEERKRKLDVLYAGLSTTARPSDGARYDDPPIPTRVSNLHAASAAIRPLIPTPPAKRTPPPLERQNAFSLYCPEVDGVEEEEAPTEIDK
jgi:hypothetical protein